MPTDRIDAGSSKTAMVVRLPSFWFHQLDAQFALYGVTMDDKASNLHHTVSSEHSGNQSATVTEVMPWRWNVIIHHEILLVGRIIDPRLLLEFL